MNIIKEHDKEQLMKQKLDQQSKNTPRWKRLIQNVNLENKEYIEYENKNQIDEYIDNYFFKNCAHNSRKQISDVVCEPD